MSRVVEPAPPAARKDTLGRGDWATHAALVLVQFAFASQAVEAKVAMLGKAQGGEGIFPETLAMFRMLGGLVFFLLIGATVRARPSISRVDHARIAGLAVLGIVLNQTLFLVGLRWTTPFAVSLLGATIPVFAATLSVVFGQERFSAWTGCGLGLAASGVLVLTGIGSFDRGVVLVAANSLSYAAYVVLSRGVVLRVGVAAFMRWLFTWSVVLFAPVGASSLLGQVRELSPRGWTFIAYIVAVPTILAYGLNAWALGRSSPTRVTVYIYLQPLIAGALAYVQLGHAVSPRAVWAAALIFAGLTLVIVKGSKKQLPGAATASPTE